MRVFGFDIGTTSIGFAAIEVDESGGAGTILRLGSRIFPEARDPDGTPLNQQRRAKRMMRRQLRRRRQRRRVLNELLAEHGLLPAYNSAEWAKIAALDPYALRARALAEPLAPCELGRALYHLAKRRHFKERDLAETGATDGTSPDIEPSLKGRRNGEARNDAKPQTEEDKKEEEEKRKRAAFVVTLKASGQTIGQALATRDPIKERKRAEHATRAVVEDEFDRILLAQKPHHTALQDEAVVASLREAIFAQRPVFWRKSTLGACRLMPGEPLCPKGSWLSQQRVLLEKLNNLEIAGGNRRKLNEDERAAILAKLATQSKMSWPGVRAALEPLFKAQGESTKYLKFNLELGDERGGLRGNVVEASLAKILGERWAAYPRKNELRSFLPDALWRADYGEIGTQRVVIKPEKARGVARTALIARLIAEFGTSRAQAEAMIKLHYPQGWEPFSTKALEVILPELENGTRFGQLISSNEPDCVRWREKVFPNREQPTGEILDRLPSPKDRDEQRRLASIRNPTVVRVQNELRKVVNSLIGAHGKPDLIRIELARAIGLSKKEREDRTNGMRKRERERKAAETDLKNNGVVDPSGEDIEKWLLWQECGKTCPYTGRQIGFADLFKLGQFQVEHIWPRSRSLDDSFRNKTLCWKQVNIDKGNKLPIQYFGDDSEAWAAAKDRVWKMVGLKGMAPGKAKRFCAESLPDDFAARQLTDTGYAARLASAMLKRLWPDFGPTSPVNVRPVTGRVTAQLRKLWGLNHLLGDDGEKNRADHRHHAVDALVVACTREGLTIKLSHYFEAEDAYRRGLGQKPSFTAERPWPSLRDDAEAALAQVIVSHRVQKKVSGPLHKDTVYGDTGREDRSRHQTYRYLVRRKPLKDMGKGELASIVDERVREIAVNWLAANGGDPQKAFATLPTLGVSGPSIRKARLEIKRQISLVAPISNGYADLGNNHHVAIYRTPDGKVDFDVVSLFEASQRVAKRIQIVSRDRGDGSQFLMSLSIGDTLQFAKDSGSCRAYWRVQKIASKGQISLLNVNDASPKEASLFEPTVGGIMARNPLKLAIDPIGRVRLAND